jgi:hypothetical protein
MQNTILHKQGKEYKFIYISNSQLTCSSLIPLFSCILVYNIHVDKHDETMSENAGRAQLTYISSYKTQIN